MKVFEEEIKCQEMAVKRFLRLVKIIC